MCRGQWGYGYYPYGYGGYGWGGWGGTVQGDIARGLGYFNMGAGIYNRETAQARSINTDTAMRWNEYVYRSQQEGTREYYARRDANLARDRDAYNTFTKRMQDQPDRSGHRERRCPERGPRPALRPEDPYLRLADGRHARYPPR